MSTFSCSRDNDLGPAMLDGTGARSVKVGCGEEGLILSLALGLKERLINGICTFASDGMLERAKALVNITEWFGSIK